MRVWYYLVRVVAIYHIIAVPVRIVYQQFDWWDDVLLLCTDLPADILLLLFHLTGSAWRKA